MIKKSILLLLPAILFILNTGNAQTSLFKPFTLIIIEPDTAQLDPSLKKYADSMQHDHLIQYYSSLRQMENMAQDTAYTPEFKRKVGKDNMKEYEDNMRTKLENAKKNEAEMKQFKYYQSISEFSASVYEYYFNEFAPYSTFEIIKAKHWDKASLKHIADSTHADYVMGYKNIHSDVYNAHQVLKMTTILFSANENKVLLEKETMGDGTNMGGMWECNNSLNCMLATIVKTSFQSAYPILSQRQKK